MRYRLMATYQGSPFEAGIGPADGDIVLFAACPPPEELGFEPATGHWRKQLRLGDVQAVWESRPVGIFRGERCMVLDDLGDRLHIGYLGHDAFRAEQLGYWQVDRGVFELVAPRTDVSDILEERTEYRRQVSPPEPEGYLPPAAEPEPPLSVTPDGPGYASRPEPPSGQFPVAPVGYATADEPIIASQPPVMYVPVPDGTTGVSLPIAAEAPLPLEAEALRAASAARRPRQTAAGPSDQPAPAAPQQAAQAAEPIQAAQAAPGAQPTTGAQPAPLSSAAVAPGNSAPARPTQTAQATPGAQPTTGAQPAPLSSPASAAAGSAALQRATAGPGHSAAPSRSRRSARRRLATELLFAELAELAGIPASTYSIGDEVEGALCLVQAEHGFEVFHLAGGARHELQVFVSEESACFYLFGVLAAEAVRNGSLGLVPASASAAQA